MLHRVRHNKKAFSLLEVMIALVIIGILTSVVGWNTYQLIGFHRFQAEIDQLCISLQEAQLLAVTHQTEFQLLLNCDQKGAWVYQLRTDEPLTQIDRKSHPLKETHTLTCDGKKCHSLVLMVDRSGRIDPPVLLHFAQKEKEELTHRSLDIDLREPLLIKRAQ